jgi:hypothetical protein
MLAGNTHKKKKQHYCRPDKNYLLTQFGLQAANPWGGN